MIQFKKVILHNFGSYGHTEIDLQNRGFCLISGQNNYVKDNALSNGSGKSMAFNAICYALTGETLSGVRNNLKNINIDEPDSYVQLEFIYQKDLYNICRIITPKSDLKIFRNDIEFSGKGIRESEKKLQEFLPELTKDFIASTLLLGQGMPHKFSSFSPSGRKDLLEKLTKSDFMIEDIKNRISTRQQELSTKAREFEDSLLANRTQLSGYLSQLEKLKEAINSQQQLDFESRIKQHEESINKLAIEIKNNQEAINFTESQIELINSKLLKITSEKTKVINEELAAYSLKYTELTSNRAKFEAELKTLNNEISKLKAITNICPTCGQSLPNICKPDTSDLEAKASALQLDLTKVSSEIKRCDQQHEEYQNQIEDAFKEEINVSNKDLLDNKSSLQKHKQQLQVLQTNIEREKLTYNQLVYDKQNWAYYVQKQQKELAELEKEIAHLTNIISLTSTAKDDYDQRLTIIKKMDQLTKRDFRGYLLCNIINYINQKAKKYCETVFGTKELSLEINGNALDITYCNKSFDSLSGGEKQRVDLIIQLAIRDLLNSYLGLSANILVLDEITDFLDKKSCRAVMQLLENELNTVESVFIISHRANDLEIPIDSEIKVIKNEQGISALY